MNKAETGIHTPAELDLREVRSEQLSALADGQLYGDEFAAALAWAAEDEGRDTWGVYHLVGDVLRSSDLARPVNPAFLSRLRDELAKEAPPQRPQAPVELDPLDHVAAHLPEAANASVFRWRMVAGLASMAAVAAIGWTSFSQLQGNGGPGAQLAASSRARDGARRARGGRCRRRRSAGDDPGSPSGRVAGRPQAVRQHLGPADAGGLFAQCDV